LSTIIAITKVMNWARKPGWRIAAKDRFAGNDAPPVGDFISFNFVSLAGMVRPAARPMAAQGLIHLVPGSG
jgi:hypothetical protein